MIIKDDPAYSKQGKQLIRDIGEIWCESYTREETWISCKRVQRIFITRLGTKRMNSSCAAIFILICVDISNPDRIPQNNCVVLECKGFAHMTKKSRYI